MNAEHVIMDDKASALGLRAHRNRLCTRSRTAGAASRERRCVWITIAAVLVSAGSVGADTTLQRLAGWPYAGARAVAVDVDRDLLYLSSGGVILVLDVSDPAAPQLMYDGLHTDGHVRDLWYVGADMRLYVADWRGGLEIWDVKNPRRPVRLSASLVYYYGTDFDQPTDALITRGDFLYINANEARVHAFDISDPARPVDLGVQAGPSWYSPYDRDTDDVAVAGDYVYVAGDGIGKFLKSVDGRLSKVGEYLNSSSVPCIEVREPFAYASLNQSLGVFNISGSSPFMVGSVGVSETLNDLALKDDFVVGVNRTGLLIFDVSLPFQPEQIASLPLPEGYRVRLDGDIAYVTGDDAGLLVIDVSDAHNPVQIGGYDTVGSTTRLMVADSRAFLHQGAEGVVIADVSLPDAVQYAGRSDDGAVAESVLIGDYLYVTDWYAPALRVIDVSDVANPVEVGGVYDFYAAYIATDGEYLYVIRFDVEAQMFHLHVFGLTDPTSPVELSTIPIGPFIFECEYAHGHLFAVEYYDRGLHIINVADPYDPYEDAFYPVNWPEDVWIEGNYAYVTSFLEGLLVLDVTDPASPTLAGSYSEVFAFRSVAVAGDLAFTTTGTTDEHHLRLYDVRDPENIRELDRIGLPGDAWDLTVQENYAYVADGITGLQVVRAGKILLGDLNGDGCVDLADLAQLLAHYGMTSGAQYDDGDLDGDGDVDLADLGTLLAMYGAGC